MDSWTIKCEVVGLLEQHSMVVNGLKSKVSHVLFLGKNVSYRPCIHNKNMQDHAYSIVSHLYLKQKKLNERIQILQFSYNPCWPYDPHLQASPNGNINGLLLLHLGKQHSLLVDAFDKKPQHHLQFVAYMSS
jgi:hypothetical protein